MDTSYEQRELKMALNRAREIEKAPLADRREGKKCYEQMLADPEWVEERVRWLLNGTFGYGEQMRAKAVLRGGARSNKGAQIAMLVALYDCQCPPREAAAAYKKLSPGQKAKVNAAIARGIKHES